MRRLLFLPLFFLPLLFIMSQHSAATGVIRVDEMRAKLSFDKNPCEFSFTANNQTGESKKAKFFVELLSPQNLLRGFTVKNVTIETGENNIVFPVTFYTSDETSAKDFIWYRLNYKIYSAEDNEKFAEGILSFSEIASDIFELQAVGSDYAQEGQTYRAYTRAFHPLTQKPVANIPVESVITLEEKGKKDEIKANAITDDDGFAVFEFKFPKKLFFDDALITFNARLGSFFQTIKNRLTTLNDPSWYLQTDKPLYQPGQNIFIRSLVFNSSKTAGENKVGKIRITDPEGTTVFTAELKSSRFGIANVEWRLPDNLRLGTYTIMVIEKDSNNGVSKTFTVSRYDLPNFIVNVKPDKPFYLPKQNAKVEIRADYLFGQPVTKGTVRVVRETERTWNYREQKWETEEAETYQGKTDSSGKFTAKINLKDEYENLDEDYDSYKDLNFVAYFTDDSTKRTEQRRFDLRISKEPIHVRIIGVPSYQNKNLPMEFYLTTFYADGTPAVCDLTLNEMDSEETDAKTIRTQKLNRTNQYGVAKISDLKIKPNEADDAYIKITARDANSKVGHQTERIDFDEDPAILVSTDKTIYRPNEPVKLEIVSSEKEGVLFVNVANNQQSVYSIQTRLNEGKASLTIPYKTEFKGKLTIIAFSNFGENSFTMGSRTIVYPSPNDLKIALQTANDTHRPGNDVNVNFDVKSAEGNAVETALGVVVFDKAVAERARTDGNDGGFLSSVGYLLGYSDESIGNITRKDVDKVDLTKPIPSDFDLAVEAMLNSDAENNVTNLDDDRYQRQQAKIQSNVFRESFQKQFEPIEKALSEHYKQTYEYPKDLESLSRILQGKGINLENVLDPWGASYRIEFSIEAANDTIKFISSGADKKFGTDDDYTASDLSWGYYRQAGQKIDAVMRAYHQRTGGFILDEKTLLAELKNSDFDSRLLIDRWSMPYKFVFSVYETKYTCGLISSGADKKWATPKDDESDDFVVWSNSIDYFEKDGVAIAKSLDKELRTNGVLPKTKAEFTKTLKSNGVDFASLKDGWNRGFYVTFKTDSRYTNRVTEVPTDDGKGTRKVYTPITEESAVITIRSKGEDGKEGTQDDFTAKTFSIVVSEKSATDTTGIVIDYKKILSSNTGTITGTIKDTANNIVSGASVSISNLQTPYEDTAITNTEGKFEFNNVPVSFYEINVNASGYDSMPSKNVEVRANTTNEFNATLSPTDGERKKFMFWTGGLIGGVGYGGGSSGGGGGGISGLPMRVLYDNSSVGVTRENALVQVAAMDRDSFQKPLDLSDSSTIPKTISGGVLIVTKSGTLATPRLREYFPETLLWQPEVITDAQGKVHLNFKLADNITTWNLIVLGTTVDGQVGVAEKEIRAFQPFFIENDPPKDLTVGDEIQFPIVVRNYTDKEQAINLSLKPESWFMLKTNENQTAKVAAGNSINVLFPFQAIKFGKEQNLRVTAQTVETADAVEKKIAVHPNGQEITNTVGGIMSDSITLNTSIPNNAIEGTTNAELRIYPNLMSHVLESVENIMARPYGCAEQTISAAYPSVIVLKQNSRNATVRERVNVTDTLPHSRVSAKAQRYAREGYEKLLGYSTADGGFTYWGRGEADLALTAYAVRFLFDAKDVIEIDENVLDKARVFLLKKQNANGSWGIGDDKQNALITAYIARVLAMSAKVDFQGQEKDAKAKADSLNETIKRSLNFLRPRVDASDEPQLLALYALTAAEIKDANEAQRINTRLEKLALNEGTGSYWALELNTPFYGWGLAGRIETTALVLQALVSEPPALAGGSSRQSLINRGLLFLLKQKDRYGVWYSTQATINVLDALIALLPKGKNSNNENNEASIFVNGKFAQTVSLSSDALTTVNLSSFIVTGENKIEVKQSNKDSAASIQLVTSFYSPWQNNDTESIKRNNSSALRFSALYNKAETKIGDEITCNVEAERLGFKGYGMMLAEIGLPPGADVDRASLDKAMAESGYAFSHYDILPDRIIIYLWAKAGGVKFNFKFKPRYGIKAQTASSQLYDYYNPEARVVIAPTKFVVM